MKDIIILEKVDEKNKLSAMGILDTTAPVKIA